MVYPFSSCLCLPFGTLGTPKYGVRSAVGLPACLTTSLWSRFVTFLSRSLERDPKDGHCGQKKSAHGARLGSMNPELRRPEGETRSVHTCQRLKGFTSLHFQLLVFYLGKIPFDSPGSELLIPVSSSFFTSIPQRTDFNAWWIQTKLFPFPWLCKSL